MHLQSDSHLAFCKGPLIKEDYQPAPLSEKTLPDTFVVQITVLYKVPVVYSIVAGDEKGKLFT